MHACGACTAPRTWVDITGRVLQGDCSGAPPFEDATAGADVELRPGQCAVAAAGPAFDARSSNLWLHNLLLLVPPPGAERQGVVTHSQGRLWATNVTILGSNSDWNGPVIALATAPSMATYLGGARALLLPQHAQHGTAPRGRMPQHGMHVDVPMRLTPRRNSTTLMPRGRPWVTGRMR